MGGEIRLSLEGCYIWITRKCTDLMHDTRHQSYSNAKLLEEILTENAGR